MECRSSELCATPFTALQVNRARGPLVDLHIARAACRTVRQVRGFCSWVCSLEACLSGDRDAPVVLQGLTVLPTKHSHPSTCPRFHTACACVAMTASRLGSSPPPGDRRSYPVHPRMTCSVPARACRHSVSSDVCQTRPP